MNHKKTILIGIILSALTCFGEMTLVSFDDNGRHKKFTFSINESIINVSCNKAFGNDHCEDKINLALKEKSVVVSFDGDKVKSIQSLSVEENSQVRCLADAKNTKLECSKKEICKSGAIDIDAILDQSNLPISINECNNVPVDQGSEAVLLAKNVQNKFVDSSYIETTIKKKCPDAVETKKLADNFKKILSADALKNFRNKCLVNAADLDNKQINDKDKIDHIVKLEASIMNYLKDGLDDCKTKKGPLFYADKIDFSKFVCIKSAEIRLLRKVTCFNSDIQRSHQDFSGAKNDYDNASRDAAKNNNEKFEGKPIMMDAPPEISKPIPVKQTLAQIDKMVQDNGGTVSPEIAEKAGKLFNDSVYEPTRSAINYIDNKIFKADEASTAKYKSSNVASSGKRYQIGGNRNPASKPTANKSNRPTGVSNATAAGVMGQGVGTAATGSSNVIKKALGEEKETPSPGKAAKVDNQSHEKALSLNNESQGSVGSGQQANNNLVANSASGSSRNALYNQSPELSPKASAEVNQLVGQIKTVESAEDLKSLLGLEENQEALRHLVKPVTSGQDRSPASTADPLINKLKEYNIKLYDERTGKTIYSPEKTEYIMRLSDKGVRLLKPIGGTKK